MISGENSIRSHPTIHIPHWDRINVSDYPHSPSSDESLTDSFGCDEFRMYEFKVRRCARVRSHDWTQCPFSHPGEKAQRRDPKKYHYSGTACPEFRKGSCRRGDSCEFAHGVFECWLHPTRYRTQPCKDGTSCRRRICFFAHTLEQLRVLPASGEPDHGFCSTRNRFESHLSKSAISTSPTSILSPPFTPPSESPPLSPRTGELITSLRKMKLSGGGFWSPLIRSGLRLPFSSSSLRPNPSQAQTWPRLRELEIWENEGEEAPAMEFVESGKELRARMYARLSRENSLGSSNN